MTTTLQEALLKAGLIKKDQLDKARSDKRRQERAARVEAPRESRGERRGDHPGKGRPPSARRPETRGAPGFLERKHEHHLRTECEACGKGAPDVEYYEHDKKNFPKKWLCVECADLNTIHDNFRQTCQSQHAASGLFRRQYGPTKVFK